MKEKSIRVQSSTTCAVPQELKDRPVKGLKKKDLHCDRPLELPLFEITPSKSQVVFEGDKIPFECQASVVDENMNMFWVRKGVVVTTNRSEGIYVHKYTSQDRTMRTQRLLLNNLGKDDTGIWQCMVTTPQGNVSDDINIVVISSSALYCVAITSKTERGIYKWPKTVAGVRSELPCKRGQDRLATYDCTPEGHWRDLNVDQCEFTSDTTRKLQAIGQSLTDNLLGNSSGLLRTMRNLQKLVLTPSQLSYSTDLTLVSRALDRMAPHAYQQEELADALLNIVSLLLNLPASMFLSEQKSSKACTRLITVVEGIPHQSRRQNITKYSENIALEARTVSVDEFPGITCLAFTSIFSCQSGIVDTSPSFTKKQNNLQGSIQLPRSLVNNSGELDTDTLNLQFILYKETKLFPVTSPFHDDPAIGNHSRIAIVSSVLSANVSTPVKNLTEPIVLYFKTRRPGRNLVAAYWDFEANGGYGDWRTDGCQILPDPNVTVVHCYHLSIFTILEVNRSGEFDRGMMSGTLHLLPYPVYVGSCICLICLMAVIITYVSCFRFINVPKKLKHSVINICISILLLLIGFTMGVKRTDHHLACQIVGVGIHYLTLVAMFWITVTSYNMLKKFNKINKPPAPPPEPVAMPLPPKPMLRFYLLAWGVPLIVCGITVAVSIDHYSEPEYCFLSWDPSIGAFYSPTALLVVFNLIFFLRISRVIHKTTNNLNETDNTEEVNDIELTQSPDDGTTEIQALTSTPRRPPEDDTESIASSVMDMERQPITQLYAVVAILFLYILFYTCAGFAVAQPFKSIIPHQELIFSYLYGLTSSAFGIFMLVYFCLTRKDSCSSWRRFFFCDQNPVYDVNYHGSNHTALSNGHVVHANNDVDTENKNYNITQDVTDGSVKQSNITLIPAPPFLSDRESSVSGPTDQSTMPNFYNPKQNGIAKKFWDRQRHHSKLITKEMTKDFNGSGTDYFSGSEVNQQRGNTSDINTLMSIEIQIQPNGVAGQSNGVSLPVSSLPLSQQNLYPTQLLLPAIKGSSGPIPKFSMLPLDRNIIPPVGGSVSPITVTTSPCCSTVSHTGSQVASTHGRSPSACSLGMRPYPSAFTPVPPRNNTLPKQGKNPTTQNNVTSTSPTQDYMMRNGSVPRLRDFDGQSQVSDACPREKQWGMQVTNNYLNNNHPNNNQAAPAYDPLSRISPQQKVGCTYKQYGSVDEHITSDRPPPSYHFSRARSSSGGYSSDTSGRIQRKHEQSFLQEVHQRIPSDNNKKSLQDHNHTQSPPPQNNKSPVNSDICNNTKIFTTHDSDSQIHVRRNRGNDSDHNSEPTSQASHRRRHRSHDPQHRHSKHHKQSAKKQHSSSAEWEGTPRSKMIPYAYVNYHYHDRVRQKLQRKHGPESRAFPHLMEDTSSSSDSEGLDDIWVMQDQNKSKKETSV